MIAYLIKSAFCLTMLLAVYHLLLEKEAIHRFKRMFLLASLAFSLTIPLISINIAMPESPVADITRLAPIASFTHDDMANVTISPRTRVVVTQPDGLAWQDYMLIIYIVVTAVLLVRFMINLRLIRSKVQRNERVNIEGGVLILVKEAIIPNSFLKYIFVNREEYRSNDMEPELLMHELVHVHQKHSLDIILIELLKAILWFNPLFILYKKAIQLNHEFLADDGVIKANTDIKGYQNLLLTKAGLQSNFALASNFNYSVTKKRLIMMKTSTTKLKAVAKGFALLPLILILAIVICVKAEAKFELPSARNPQTAKADTLKPAQQTPTVVNRDSISPDSVIIHYTRKDGSKVTKKLSELPAEKQKQLGSFARRYVIASIKYPSVKQFNAWKNASMYGIWLDDKHVSNDVLNNYAAKDIVMFNNSKLYGAAKKGRSYYYQADLYTLSKYKELKAENEAVNKKPRKIINIYSTEVLN
nr:M56 family metallopeptidase [uncultured Mucilaginibacter sp.]